MIIVFCLLFGRSKEYINKMLVVLHDRRNIFSLPNGIDIVLFHNFLSARIFRFDSFFEHIGKYFSNSRADDGEAELEDIHIVGEDERVLCIFEAFDVDFVVLR